jgi:hypothetical protein
MNVILETWFTTAHRTTNENSWKYIAHKKLLKIFFHVQGESHFQYTWHSFKYIPKGYSSYFYIRVSSRILWTMDNVIFARQYLHMLSTVMLWNHHRVLWLFDLQKPTQSMPITTKVVSSNPTHFKVYSMQHYVIKFVSHLRLVGVFLLVLLFPPAIKQPPWYLYNIVESGVLTTLVVIGIDCVGFCKSNNHKTRWSLHIWYLQ